MKRYVEAILRPSDQLLTEYGITWTIFLPQRPAVMLLDRLPGWRRLHADDIAVVHVRDDPSAR